MPSVAVKEIGTTFRSQLAKVGQIAFSSAGTVSLELPRGFLYKTVYLRLTGAVNTTVAGGALASDEQPTELLKKVVIIGDGRKQFVNATGRQLYALTRFQRGITPPLRGMNATGVALYPLELVIAIDFEAARMRMPADSYMDSRPFEKLELIVTWGALTDLVTGGTSAFLPNPVLDVFAAMTTKGVELSAFNRLHVFESIPVTATSTALMARVPRAGLYAGTLISSIGGAIAGKSLDDAIVNFVTVKSDVAFIHVSRLSWLDLLAKTAVDYQAGTRINADLTALAAGYFAAGPSGHVLMDITEDGLIGAALNVNELNQLDYEYDVTTGAGTDRLDLLHVYYEPIR